MEASGLETSLQLTEVFRPAVRNAVLCVVEAWRCIDAERRVGPGPNSGVAWLVAILCTVACNRVVDGFRDGDVPLVLVTNAPSKEDILDREQCDLEWLI